MARMEQGRLVVYDNLGFESRTVSTSAVGLSSIPANDIVYYFTVSVVTEEVRVRADGTNPTSTVGYLLPTGSVTTFYINPSTLKLIRDTGAGGDAVVEVLYFGVNQ